ncbi:hypothetical protein POM88_036169 [Heracleum sosnowskyi]|uniref:Uncharacterized protein n=1 Tax=Heracleum sosnowskyi TaxID=360622 RepID=A0AAD8HPP3_9APIA|nr:hypothetical protein POM88_036169 [Heracleum sosnowskyi]
MESKRMICVPLLLQLISVCNSLPVYLISKCIRYVGSKPQYFLTRNNCLKQSSPSTQTLAYADCFRTLSMVDESHPDPGVLIFTLATLKEIFCCGIYILSLHHITPTITEVHGHRFLRKWLSISQGCKIYEHPWFRASSKVCGTEKVKKFIAGGLDDNQLHSDRTPGFLGLLLDKNLGIFC